MKVGDYEIDILVQGFPGKGVFNGGLGWSTVVLIQTADRKLMLDGGGFSMRGIVASRLAQRGVTPGDITDMLLTHAHHDHMVNWVLFRNARIAIGAYELECAAKLPWGETPTPELYVQELKSWPMLHTLEDGEEAFPGITAHMAPGHTRGHLIFVLHGPEYDVIFTGDAAKNRAELVSRATDMTYGPTVSAASIDKIWELWQRRPGSILVPGHDLAMVQENGSCRYIAKREAAIIAWYGDDMKTTTLFDLTGGVRL
jgi:glyoxylase-like metal-dependent hydrolase (beta-lactamase superfamily II)